MMNRFRPQILAIAMLAAIFLPYNFASAQKGAKGAGGASPSAGASPASPSAGGASSAPIEVQMLSFGALDEILDKLASRVCSLGPDKVIVLDAPSLLALQNFDSFYLNAEALRGAFSTMAGGGGAGGSIDDFADVTSAVSAAAVASTSETSSSFTITDPTVALMMLNHLGRQGEGGKLCQKAYYAGVYGAEETKNIFFNPKSDKDAKGNPIPVRQVLSELDELSLARMTAFRVLMGIITAPDNSKNDKDKDGKGLPVTTMPAPGSTQLPTAGISDGPMRLPILRRLSYLPQSSQPPPPAPKPIGPPLAGPQNVPVNPNQHANGTLTGVVSPAPVTGGTQSPQITLFTNLDTTYNSFIAGLSAPSATTGQPLLSSIVQGFRIRSLMACVVDPNDNENPSCPGDDHPVIGVYVNVAFAGGTLQDRKNLITAVITGDWIRYSGGVSVNVVVFQIGGTKPRILFADLLRYRTPLKTINKPDCYFGAGSYGDNLGDIAFGTPTASPSKPANKPTAKEKRCHDAL
jgi:hypothetical protein